MRQCIPCILSYCLFLVDKNLYCQGWRENILVLQFSSFAQPYLTLWPYGLQHTRPPWCAAWVYPNSCPLSQWCHLTISYSVLPFSSYLQSFPALGSFPMSLCIRWPKYWSVSFSISPSNEYSGLISFRIDWLDLSAVQGTLKSLLQHRSSKALILQHSAFLHPCVTTGKTIALTRWTFVSKVMSLLFNMLSRLVIVFFQGANIF